jgi:hypothetical protein
MVYGRGIVRPRWSTWRVFVSGSMVSSAGFGYGFKQKLDAHRKFARALENPAGFNRALQGVNLRLGGTTPWNYGVPVREDLLDDSTPRATPDNEFQEERDRGTGSSAGLWGASPTPSSSPTPTRPTPQPQGTRLNFPALETFAQ